MNNWEDYKDIFEPFERLVKIEICGKIYEVPESNQLLRCFQFLNVESISMGDFCWNGDCANCQVWIETENGDKPALSCRTKVSENMRIVKMAEEILL